MLKLISLICSVIFTISLNTYSSESFSWGTVTMGGGGFVSAIITSKSEKNLIYARTDVGGAYRWNESDGSWISLTDWAGPDNMGLLGVDAIAIDPDKPSRLYMLAGTDYWNEGKTYILRSDDYGSAFDTINVTSNFKTHGNGYGRQNGERLAVDPNNSDILFCGTRKNGLWKSIDRGSTWTQVSTVSAPANAEGICFVMFDKNRADGGVTRRIYIGKSVAGAENLFVSDDGGKTWEPIPLPELSKQVMPQRAALTPGGKYLYLAVANGAGPGFGNGTTISRGGFLKYDTEAKEWQNVSPENWIDDPTDDPSTAWSAHFGGIGGVSIDASDSDHIIISSINTWKPQRWNNSTKAGWGDKIFVTSDGGKTWKSVFGDKRDDDISTFSETELMAVLDKNGYNWIEGESLHWAGSIEFDPFNPRRVFVTSGNGIYMTDELAPGERFRWKFCVKGLEETVPSDLVSIPGGPLITTIFDYDGFVHDDITKPVAGSRHTPKIGSTTSIDYAQKNPGIVVRAGGNDKPDTSKDYVFPLYYSLDTGNTWTKFATHPGAGQNYKGQIAISNDGKVVLWNPEEKNTVYRTDDWGKTWTTSTGISAMKCFTAADPVNPDVFYAFNGNVYKSTDKGVSFEKISSRNFSYTTDMQLTPGVEGHIWVCGYSWDGINGGFLARSTDGGLTFTDIDPVNDSSKFSMKIQHSEAIGFGKAAEGADYPAIYIYGTIGGVKGIYQSVDQAKTWTRIDDNKHLFGALANGNFVRGDMNTFGVVYRSTAGRGIAARMPSSWTVTNSRNSRFFNTADPAGKIITLKGNTIHFKAADEPGLEIQICRLDGRSVYEKTFDKISSVNLRSVVSASGIYFLCIKNRNRCTLYRNTINIVK